MLVITTIGNCIEFDFTAVPNELNPTDLRKICLQKENIRVSLPINLAGFVRVVIYNDEIFEIPYNLVSLVNGILPTSDDHLYELLINAYSQ